MKKYTCSCCDKTWSSKAHYNIHMNTKKNTGEPRKKYKIRVSNTAYKPPKKWNCELCNKEFVGKASFKKHCLDNFTTHAMYAQELKLNIYKKGYTSDGVKIESSSDSEMNFDSE